MMPLNQSWYQSSNKKGDTDNNAEAKLSSVQRTHLTLATKAMRLKPLAKIFNHTCNILIYR
jgi:hypothetical protein